MNIYIIVLSGEWYLLSSDQYGKGWIWSDKLQLNGVLPERTVFEPTRTSTPTATITPTATPTLPTEPIGFGITVARARLWDSANAQTGEPIFEVEKDLQFSIWRGPVEGAIRSDGSVMGDWYYVEIPGGQRGWMWAGSFNFVDPDMITPTVEAPTMTQTPKVRTRTPRPQTQTTHFPTAVAIEEGITIRSVRLWTMPDARFDNVIQIIPEGTWIEVLRGPIEGYIETYEKQIGVWYYVRLPNGKRGWVQTKYLDLSVTERPTSTPTRTPSATKTPTATPSLTPTPTETPTPESIGSATALSGARIWSEPNAQTGQYTGDLEEGAELRIIEGPVQGAIRADGSLTADWYLVETLDGSQSGWVWVGRITIHPK